MSNERPKLYYTSIAEQQRDRDARRRAIQRSHMAAGLALIGCLVLAAVLVIVFYK